MKRWSVLDSYTSLISYIARSRAVLRWRTSDTLDQIDRTWELSARQSFEFRGQPSFSNSYDPVAMSRAGSAPLA